MTTDKIIYWCTDTNVSEEWNYEHLISPDEVSTALGYFDVILDGRLDVIVELDRIIDALNSALKSEYVITNTPEYCFDAIDRFVNLWDSYTEHFNVVPEPVTPKQVPKVDSIKEHLNKIKSRVDQIIGLTELEYTKPYQGMIAYIKYMVNKILI